MLKTWHLKEEWTAELVPLPPPLTYRRMCLNSSRFTENPRFSLATLIVLCFSHANKEFRGFEPTTRAAHVFCWDALIKGSPPKRCRVSALSPSARLQGDWWFPKLSCARATLQHALWCVLNQLAEAPWCCKQIWGSRKEVHLLCSTPKILWNLQQLQKFLRVAGGGFSFHTRSNLISALKTQKAPTYC